MRVLEPKININKKNKEISISISIEEGARYRVGKISAEADEIVSEDEILKSIQTKSKDIYSMSKIRAGVLSIGELYSERGYAYADVNPVVKVNDKSRTVDLSIEIDKGRKVYVGEISVIGNTRTLDRVIRREFRLTEGELFDSVKLKRSKQRINNLQFFEDVKIDTRRGKESDLIDIITTVTERPTGSINVGAGFSSSENLIFNAGISQNNFLGRGQRVVFSTNLSSRRTDFNLSLTDPRILDTEILGGIDAFNRKTDYYSYKARNTGGGVRFGKSLSEFDWIGINYKYDDVEISDVSSTSTSAYLKNGSRVTSRISPTFIRDTRDDYLNPSSGSRHVVRFGFSRPWEVPNFIKCLTKEVTIDPLLANWLEWFMVLYPGLTAMEMRIYQYLNGIIWEARKVLEGILLRILGLKMINDNPLGGNQSLLLNLELQYPFTKGLRAFAFYDRGNLYGGGNKMSTTSTTWDLGKMRDSIGAGIRFMSPMGPLGFAYGIKLDQATGEESGEFHFSAGNSF